MQELREHQTSRLGRAKLRERITVEHSLAHIGQWQGDRARYLGIRKNLFDLRRMQDPHLRSKAMAIVANSDRYECEFDEQGTPIAVLELKF